ncbi:hypothetical protein COL154_012131 [Colletotrichum chrysophilum]|uniref:Uncharacterized protein n=1 Tax=Colletotrichum chrysophilum TaxID=1836956 RepID=A0AAD9EG40_9PEZI|nr:uncharacterized protein COL26b_008300 [Colletotrichum chrysophilum]KAJ0350571.1 hypothetical protein KNSL1_003974 [Colletotrichum chrysophilum]KAJ0353435.1 hypothetical protein COL154_012131 [Colletotrichum chrysophilum]KAJ0373442.1 hypothetical protein COL26b_008300 [Colletotrichum chrysophilum]KAK1847158.1 hypothetical protein CCHR01_10203 [Colletotrichum chrysophilum]
MSPIAPSRATSAHRPFFKLGNPNVKSTIRAETRLKTAGPGGALGKRSNAPSRPPLKPAPARVDKKTRVGQAGRKNSSNLPRNKSGRARKGPKILANHGDRAGFTPVAQMAAPPPPPPGRHFLPSPSLSPPPSLFPPPAPSHEHRPPAPSTVGTVIRKRKAPPTMLLPMRRPKPYSR